ncbi:MAG: flagellar motor switch protein FliN [Proteobacteria bacterium]|nr:flagellar motor switch protein FliN [Pseudomonadota bacterium]MBU1640933.1 flagellar motor switch protein FliN [Pseudomonadota bacterium]
MADDESLDDAWADALEEANPELSKKGKKDDSDWDALSEDNGPADTASFQELGAGEMGKGGNQNLEFLLDIPLEISVELGRASMIIDRMLQLTQGSVIELEKAAGETVEIYVNKKLLGKGEVIVVNDRFGVRITEVISQADRIKNIG